MLLQRLLKFSEQRQRGHILCQLPLPVTTRHCYLKEIYSAEQAGNKAACLYWSCSLSSGSLFCENCSSCYEYQFTEFLVKMFFGLNCIEDIMTNSLEFGGRFSIGSPRIGLFLLLWIEQSYYGWLFLELFIYIHKIFRYFFLNRVSVLMCIKYRNVYTKSTFRKKHTHTYIYIYIYTYTYCL